MLWQVLFTKSQQTQERVDVLMMRSQDMPHCDAEHEAPSPYQYAALSQGDDMRLIVLLPGRHNDRIRIRIQHDKLDRVAFRVPRARRMSISDIQATLPDDWWVEETIDHRVIFNCGKSTDQKGWKSSWTHPDPAFDHSLYKSPEDHGCEGMPGYEALSYTWGPLNPAEDALVEGETPGQTRLSIGPGLADALRHLRFPDRPRTLWVDAICINQTDEAEKNVHVARMDGIYRYARRVVVWLGADNNTSALAIEALTQLGNQVQVALKSSRWFTEPGLESECCGDNCRVPHENSCPLPWPEATCRAVKDFFWRPWFSRVWVVQEVLLANEDAVLQCGSHLMTWSVFRQAIVCLWNKENLPALLPRHDVAHIHEIVRWNLESNMTAISEMLVLTTNRQCADPRDFIYGMRGLLPSAFAARIQVRYGASVREIYTDFILHHIQYTRRLLFLGSFRMRDRGGPERMPSWVPDFATEIAFQYWHFSAGCSVSFATTNPARIGELRVLGRQCAVIDKVQPVPDTFLERLLGNVEQEERDALARILAGGYLCDRFPGESVPTLAGWVEMLLANHGRLLRKVLADQSEEGHDDQDPNAPVQSTFMEYWAREVIRDRVFITTSEGHIGLGGPESRPGDRICVFLGCDAPMMLRTSEEANGLFSVVGQCLVDGLEDACALLGPLPKGWRLQVFPDFSSSSARCRFFHVETGRTVEEDPRLPDFDTDEWEIIEDVARTADDPFTYRAFRHIPTGDVVKSDPRMTPEALERRGVSLKTFVLV